MKTRIGSACVLFIALAAHADSASLSARGSAFGTCDQTTFDVCALMLQQQAQRSAESDLSNQCYQLRGSISGNYCRTQCNPFMAPPPPNPTPIFTTCTAECNATCYVN